MNGIMNKRDPIIPLPPPKEYSKMDLAKFASEA